MLIKRYAFKKISSTQEWTAKHLETIPKNGWLVVTSNIQTKGLGTRDRHWYSPSGNLYATLATRISSQLKSPLQIPQITVLAVAETLEYFGFKPAIKWVNDVLLNNKKAGGILTEIKTASYGKALLIGIGLNINMTDVTAIPYATSLFIETHKKYNIEKIFKKIQQFFYKNIHLYFENVTLINEIEKRLTCKKGNLITFKQNNGKIFHGVFWGLNKNGFIRIKQKSGSILEFSSGKIIAS